MGTEITNHNIAKCSVCFKHLRKITRKYQKSSCNETSKMSVEVMKSVNTDENK